MRRRPARQPRRLPRRRAEHPGQRHARGQAPPSGRPPARRAPRQGCAAASCRGQRPDRQPDRSSAGPAPSPPRSPPPSASGGAPRAAAPPPAPVRTAGRPRRRTAPRTARPAPAAARTCPRLRWHRLAAGTAGWPCRCPSRAAPRRSWPPRSGTATGRERRAPAARPGCRPGEAPRARRPGWPAATRPAAHPSARARPTSRAPSDSAAPPRRCRAVRPARTTGPNRAARLRPWRRCARGAAGFKAVPTCYRSSPPCAPCWWLGRSSTRLAFFTGAARAGRLRPARPRGPRRRPHPPCTVGNDLPALACRPPRRVRAAGARAPGSLSSSASPPRPGPACPRSAPPAARLRKGFPHPARLPDPARHGGSST